MDISLSLNNILQSVGVAIILVMVVVWVVRRILRRRGKKCDVDVNCSCCDADCPIKPKHGKKLPLWIAAILCCHPSHGAASVNEGKLRELDAMIEQMAENTRIREAQFEELRRQEAITKNLEEKFWLTRTLFDSYSVFDSDSAIVYGERAIKMAQLLDRPDLEAELRIKKSYTLTAIGLLDQGLTELEKVDRSQLTGDAMVDYLGQKVYWMTHADQYKNITRQDEPYPEAVAAVLDTIHDIIDTSHPDYIFYVCYRAMRLDDDEKRAALLQVEPMMKDFKYTTCQEAKAAWTVSQLNRLLGRPAQHEEMLVNSAMADLRVVNRDIASLEELADVRHHKGDLERAYKYIGLCLECAERYKNRVRVLAVATMQTDISKAYQERVTYLQSQTHTYLSVLVVR